VSLALAAAPGAALAQNGAGDDQYADPFSGGSQQPSSKPKPKPQPQQQQHTTPAQPAPQQQTQSSGQQSPAQTPSAQQGSAGQAAQLPRTGFDVVPLAIAGATLVIAGLLLLRRRSAVDGRD
jgi:LPXTG-motif cell wall-anchored protein